MDAAGVLENYISDLGSLPSEFTFILESLRDQDSKFYEVRKRIAQRDGQIHKFIKANGSLTENPKEAQLSSKITQDFDTAAGLCQEKIDMANAGLYIVSRHIKRLNEDILKLEEEGLLPHVPGSVCNQAEKSAGLILDGHGGVTVGGELDFTQDKISVGRRGATGSRAGAASSGTGAGGSSGGTANGRLNGPDSGSGLANGHVGLNGSVGATRGASASHSPSPGPSLSSRGSRPTKRQKTEFGPGSGPGSASSTGLGGFGTPGMGDSDFGSITPRQNGRGGNEEEEVLYCVCQQVSFGNMVACDNPDCQYEWFHYDCVGLKEPPKGTWYCPTCVKEKKEERRRRG